MQLLKKIIMIGLSCSMLPALATNPPSYKLFESETEALLNPSAPKILGLLPYEQNYIMESFTNKNFAYDKHKMHSDEVKYQISLALPIWKNILGKDSILAGAYTQTSWFQMTNVDDSSPFRETNYKPQLFLAWMKNYPLIAGWKLSEIETGVLHESNGRDDSELRSRSWNRIYTRLSASKGNWRVQIKPWWRIPEKKDDDDNPDIEHYRGHMDFIVDYYTPTHQVYLKTHYNPKYGKGGVELSYSYPLTHYIRFYAQYYGGYGESLIDYNKNIQRFGMGISLNNIF